MHSNFDQTNNNGSDFMDRKNLENTTFLPKAGTELVLPSKAEFAATNLTEFFRFKGTKTQTQTKIEEIKHKLQRKHKSCDPKIDKV